MPAPSHITVTAPPGRQTPISAPDGCEPGGAMLYAMPGEVIRVRFGSQSIRRSIGRGDLIMCDMNGVQVTSAELAAAPEDLPGGKIVIAELAVKRDVRLGKATP